MRNKLIIFSLVYGNTGREFRRIYLQHHQARHPGIQPGRRSLVRGIYAEGIVESAQSSGENINIYPEVPGTVKQIFVAEGQEVRKGAPLLLIDESIQRATTEQQKSAAQAAHACSRN